MKKLITFALMLAMVVMLASCSMLPEDMQATINGIFGENNNVDDGPHTHEFVVTESVEVGCETDGYTKSACSCGETKEESFTATGHDMQPNGCMEATCTQKGINYFKCSNCGKSKSEIVSPLGHEFGEPPEASRFAYCTRPNCVTGAFVTVSNGTYTEQLTFNFTKEHEDEITAKYEEVLKAITGAPSYNPDVHGYATEGALADEYAIVDALHNELYDLVLYAIAQRQIAEIDYYCDMKSPEIEERYSYMMDYYTDLIATFYSLSQPFYDSCYREFFYHGMTEDEIMSYLFDSSTISNPEYMALKARNDEIELLYFDIADPLTDPLVCELYAEYVANNNRMAQIILDDDSATYLDYAYENVYSRDYTYQDVAKIVDYVKEYVAPAFIKEYNNYVKIKQTGDYNKDAYSAQVTASFFTNVKGNTTLNDYIDLMAFTSNPDKQISFSDEFNGLMSNGNLFRGQYSGAFVTSLSAFDIPIAYFSGGYDNPFTIAHEFGHYMNEVYNRDEYSQSYDLLEIHSQGNEMLYLNYLNGKIDGSAYQAVKSDSITNMLYIIMAALAIDTFEQAIYLDSYDGVGADTIMADGTITADEYDYLYYCVTEDLGVRGFISDNYWRHGMTIRSACYYVSYAVSALSAIQIYEMAETDGFEAASEAYLKLFTYTDVDPEMNSEEILVYAGMYSYNDEELYKSLYNYFVGN